MKLKSIQAAFMDLFTLYLLVFFVCFFVDLLLILGFTFYLIFVCLFFCIYLTLSNDNKIIMYFLIFYNFGSLAAKCSYFVCELQERSWTFL